MVISDRNEVTTTVQAGPPKYQVVIPQQARRALGIDGKDSILQITIEPKRIETDSDEDEGGDK